MYDVLMFLVAEYDRRHGTMTEVTFRPRGETHLNLRKPINIECKVGFSSILAATEWLQGELK